MKSEAALKQTEKGIEELIAALEQGKSEALVLFLEFQARFHQYSFRNCLLIAMQNPSATYVAGFNRWKQLGRYVKQGEKGLLILAPIVARKIETEGDGDRDERETARTVRGFRAAYVFDVSQTEGAELPEFSQISGNPGEMLTRVQAYVRSLGIELESAPQLGGAQGRSQGGKIVILQGLTPAEDFAVTVHELAHELLHRGERRKVTTRRTRELEAEAVSFVVSRSVGLETGSHSADYIQLYGGDKELLVQSLDHIQRVAAQIIKALETADAIAQAA